MDYTPTTTEVRNAFTFSMGSGDENNSCFPANRAAFDRWLAEVKAEQDKATTERIIGLLEERNWHYYHDWNPTPEQVSGIVWGIREAIALIKGTVANNATTEPVGKPTSWERTSE